MPSPHTAGAGGGKPCQKQRERTGLDLQAVKDFLKMIQRRDKLATGSRFLTTLIVVVEKQQWDDWLENQIRDSSCQPKPQKPLMQLP